MYNIANSCIHCEVLYMFYRLLVTPVCFMYMPTRAMCGTLSRQLEYKNMVSQL